MRHDLRSEDGLTLVELSIASFIMLIISASVLTALVMVVRTEALTQEGTETLSEARFARQRLERDIREATEVGSGSTDRILELWVDADDDGVRDADEEITWTLTYVGDGTAALWRTTTAGGSTWGGDDFVDPTVGAYQAFTFDMTPPAASAVTFTLVVDTDTGGDGAQAEITTTVRLRNV